ncbi:hypothetical protein MT378_21890, partial [Psychrobacter sp. 16-Bac2893]
AISRDVQDLHREQYTQLDQRGYARERERRQSMSAAADSGETGTSQSDRLVHDGQSNGQAAASTAYNQQPNTRKLDIHSAVNQYVRTQQSQDSTLDDNTNGTTADAASNMTDSDVNDHTAYKADDSSQHANNHVSRLSATRAFDSVSVQIVFHDEFNMLERLAPSQRLPYLALCTQLLNQAVTELLKQPLLLGVSAINEPH